MQEIVNTIGLSGEITLNNNQKLVCVLKQVKDLELVEQIPVMVSLSGENTIDSSLGISGDAVLTGDPGLDDLKHLVFQETLSAFSNVMFSTPDAVDQHPVHLSVTVFSKPDGGYIASYNTLADTFVRKASKYLNSNVDPFAWMPFPEVGVGLSKTPVIVSFGDILKTAGVELSSVIAEKKRFYVNYLWFWKGESDQIEKSSEASLVFPAFAEPGDPVRQSVSKKEFTDLKTAITPPKVEVETETAFSTWKAAYCKPSEFTTVIGDLRCNTDRQNADFIVLDNYDLNLDAEWRIKFRTSGTGVAAGYIQFAKSIGHSSPDVMSDSNLQNNDEYKKFVPNKNYMIVIRYDVMQIYPLAS